jgi:hypothetical protein
MQFDRNTKMFHKISFFVTEIIQTMKQPGGYATIEQKMI